MSSQNVFSTSIARRTRKAPAPEASKGPNPKRRALADSSESESEKDIHVSRPKRVSARCVTSDDSEYDFEDSSIKKKPGNIRKTKDSNKYVSSSSSSSELESDSDAWDVEDQTDDQQSEEFSDPTSSRRQLKRKRTYKKRTQLSYEAAEPILMEIFHQNPQFRDYRNPELREKTRWPIQRINEFFDNCRRENGISANFPLPEEQAHPILMEIFAKDPFFNDYGNIELKNKIHWAPRRVSKFLNDLRKEHGLLAPLPKTEAELILMEIFRKNQLFSDFKNINLKRKLRWPSRKIERWFLRQRNLEREKLRKETGTPFDDAMERIFQKQQYFRIRTKNLEVVTGGDWNKISKWLKNKRRNTLEAYFKKEISVLPTEMANFERLHQRYNNPLGIDAVRLIEQREKVCGYNLADYLLERWRVLAMLQEQGIHQTSPVNCQFLEDQEHRQASPCEAIAEVGENDQVDVENPGEVQINADDEIRHQSIKQKQQQKLNLFNDVMEKVFQERQFIAISNEALEMKTGYPWSKISNWLKTKRRDILESYFREAISVLPTEMATFERIHQKYNSPMGADAVAFIELKENVSGYNLSEYFVDRQVVMANIRKDMEDVHEEQEEEEFENEQDAHEEDHIEQDHHWFTRQRKLKQQQELAGFVGIMETIFQKKQFFRFRVKALEEKTGHPWKKIRNWLRMKRKETLKSFFKKEISVLPEEMANFERLFKKYEAYTDADKIYEIGMREDVCSNDVADYFIERFRVLKELQGETKDGNVEQEEEDELLDAQNANEEDHNEPDLEHQMDEAVDYQMDEAANELREEMDNQYEDREQEEDNDVEGLVDQQVTIREDLSIETNRQNVEQQGGQARIPKPRQMNDRRSARDDYQVEQILGKLFEEQQFLGRNKKELRRKTGCNAKFVNAADVIFRIETTENIYGDDFASYLCEREMITGELQQKVGDQLEGNEERLEEGLVAQRESSSQISEDEQGVQSGVPQEAVQMEFHLDQMEFYNPQEAPIDKELHTQEEEPVAVEPEIENDDIGFANLQDASHNEQLHGQQVEGPVANQQFPVNIKLEIPDVDVKYVEHLKVPVKQETQEPIENVEEEEEEDVEQLIVFDVIDLNTPQDIGSVGPVSTLRVQTSFEDLQPFLGNLVGFAEIGYAREPEMVENKRSLNYLESLTLPFNCSLDYLQWSKAQVMEFFCQIIKPATIRKLVEKVPAGYRLSMFQETKKKYFEKLNRGPKRRLGTFIIADGFSERYFTIRKRHTAKPNANEAGEDEEKN
ncbi:hypothetical protein L5515_015300 [Caenorhabditis briggsae]|uniref:Uncharacterized protein n=1 Tax=Caenorhabditis briggsae TaxID=6238 RepID=A0AAE9J7Z7_CAEBR|nr:hypothetical protein L5515_015300 [Caenorhabditis briggsae]